MTSATPSTLRRAPDRVGLRCALRALGPEDEPAFREAVRASAELLQPWFDPVRTEARFADRVDGSWPRRSRSYLVTRKVDGLLAGCVAVHGVPAAQNQPASLSYFGFAGGVGQGLMTEGVGLAVELAFDEHGCVALEAMIQPDNTRSLSLISRLGFRLLRSAPEVSRDGSITTIDVYGTDRERWHHHRIIERTADS